MNDELKQKKMRDFYNKGDYYRKVKSNFAHKKNRFNEYMINNVLSIYYPNKKAKILDIGCGWGNISLSLQKKGFNVTGLDYSRESISICKDSAKKLNLDPSKFICGDGTNTGLKPNSLDVVYCADLVEHLYPKVYLALIKEVNRILKKKGKFVIYTPNPTHIFEILKQKNIILKRDISHVDYKNMRGLKESLKENGFSIKKAFFIESHMPIIKNIEKIFMKIIPLFRRRIAILAIKE